MEICIVSNDNKFEAVNYTPTLKPLNCILTVPNGRTWRNAYLLINTGIKVYWEDYYNKYNDVLKVMYEDFILFEMRNITAPQIVIDVLNKYNSISKSDLEELLKESQEKQKTALEINIEELKTEKANLEEQIKIYKEIQIKKDEIKELLSKLDS